MNVYTGTITNTATGVGAKATESGLTYLTGMIILGATDTTKKNLNRLFRTMNEREDPITCKKCGRELPFAFEDQRGDITCMKCVRAEDTDQ